MPQGPAETGDAAGALGQRLDRLFKVTRAPSGRLWTNPEMAAQLSTHGIQVTAAYLSMLRHGKRENPSLEVITGVAAVFGVPTAYFYDAETADRIERDMQLIVAVRRAGLAHIVLRAAGLSEIGRREIGVIIEAFRRIEGLGDEADAPLQPAQNLQDRTVQVSDGL